ncbi:MAG: hypothetical protein LKI18_00490 [Prevotella sp.]|jgi:hypothetical protein|nr:hypothetical protein [Prevotella sp.]
MNYEIDMLDVKAADAFLVHYIDDSNHSHIVMIDSGNYNDADKIIAHIRAYYAPVKTIYGNKYIIETSIVTHPDDDHIGGFIKMLEYKRNGKLDDFEFQKFWVNDPTKHGIKPEQIKSLRKQETVDERLRSVYNYNEDTSKNLLNLLDELKITRREKFAAKFGPLPKGIFEPTSVLHEILKPVPKVYPSFTVIGPTEDYYVSLLPNFRNELKSHEGEEEEEMKYYSIFDRVSDNSLSSALDDAKDDPSAHNQSSMIVLFEPKEGVKYLFMGDAGVDAFNNIPLHLKNQIRKVNWLKVPHHGSKHNLNTDVIRWLNPKIAYISTEKRGKYLSQCVVNALKKHRASVYSTSQNRSNIVNNSITIRDGWGTIEKI